MKITIRNNTDMPKQFPRFIKWKLYQAGRKFNHLTSADIHLNEEGNKHKVYRVNLRLGIKGKDIVYQLSSNNLGELYLRLSDAIHRYLVKHKPTFKSKRNRKYEVFFQKVNQTG